MENTQEASRSLNNFLSSSVNTTTFTDQMMETFFYVIIQKGSEEEIVSALNSLQENRPELAIQMAKFILDATTNAPVSTATN